MMCNQSSNGLRMSNVVRTLDIRILDEMEEHSFICIFICGVVNHQKSDVVYTFNTVSI